MRTAAGILLATLAGCASPAQPRPNVLLILADDLNDWVGALSGNPNGRTPHIDRLASQGVLFEEAYAASPKCNPSRTALMLGLSPATTGIYDNGHWWKPHLPNAVTLPEAFREGGYLAASAGKVFHHTAGFNPPEIWDEYFALRFDDPWDRKGSAYPQVLPTEPPEGYPFAGLLPPRHELDWGSPPLDEEEYGDARTVAWAERFLERDHDKPFFLAVGLFHPHLPWYAPESYFEPFPVERAQPPEAPENDLDDVPAEGRRLAARGAEVYRKIRDEGRLQEAVAAYAANIAFADALIGRLAEALEQSAYGENTIVVFASDHGFHLGEKQHWYKSTLWERATHLPLIVRLPAGPAGERRTTPVTLLDLYPTLLELTGLPPRAELDGRSFAHLLNSGREDAERAAVMTYLRGNHAVRQGRWLYIRYHDGGEELYDRESDPGELTNLAGLPEHRALKDKLAKRLPEKDAPPAPVKSAYEFDWRDYRWEPAATTAGRP